MGRLVRTKIANFSTFGVANAHAWEAPALRCGARRRDDELAREDEPNRASADTPPNPVQCVLLLLIIVTTTNNNNTTTTVCSRLLLLLLHVLLLTDYYYYYYY